MEIENKYQSAFVVEKSKLTRLLSVIKDVFQQDDASYEEFFEASLTSGKSIRTASLQHILTLDNSERSRVERLVIGCKSEPKPSDNAAQTIRAHTIEVDFDARPSTDVTITVESDNNRIASEVMAVAEEQVERMLERGLMYRLLGRHQIYIILTMIMILTMLFLVFALITTQPVLQMSKSMWLTSSDLAEIEPIIQDTNALSPEQATEILARQLRNLIERERAAPFSVLLDWRVAMILLPVVIIIGSFGALMPCYPGAVFRWGDAEDWYQRLVARRKWIWNVAVTALVIGIIANLAVFGFGSLISGRSM